MRMVGLDIGDVRIGIAVCDEREIIASGVETYRRTGDLDQDCAYIADRVRELSAERVVLGLPINMNGTIGDRAKLCEEFAQRLEKMVEVPVRLWDERGTTVSAIGFLNETDTRGKKRKETVDQLAAAIILESYLNYRRNHPEE